MENGEILVIDLFAGPGGLGEGISAAQTSDGKSPFQIGISVEKDVHAHQTLTTRAFYRTLKTKSQSLNNYYRYLHGEITRDELFKLHPDVATEANKETLNGAKELGKDNKLIHKRIKELVKKHKGPKVLIGGPPCQAYSLAGRSRNAGNKSYIAEDDARHFLYKEYLEVICLAKPDIFVMENVRGILTAKVNGQVMFPQILEDLRSPGKVTKHKNIPKYKIYSLVVDAENPEAEEVARWHNQNPGIWLSTDRMQEPATVVWLHRHSCATIPRWSQHSRPTSLTAWGQRSKLAQARANMPAPFRWHFPGSTGTPRTRTNPTGRPSPHGQRYWGQRYARPLILTPPLTGRRALKFSRLARCSWFCQ